MVEFPACALADPVDGAFDLPRAGFDGRDGIGRCEAEVVVAMHADNRAIAQRFHDPVAVKKIIQVRIFKGEKQYVAECLDLPVVTQAKTLDELTENLREAISLHLKGEDLAELDLAEDPTVLASFELEPLIHAKAMA